MAPACQVTPSNPSEPGNAYLVNTRTWSQLPLSDPSSEGVSAVTFGQDDTLVTGDVNGDAYAWDTTIRFVRSTLIIRIRWAGAATAMLLALPRKVM